MNSINSLSRLAVTVVLILVTGVATAQVQDADLLKAMQKYNSVSTVRAMVTRTKHNALLADDEVTQGVLYVKAPYRLCMTFNGGEDKMLMNNHLFSFISAGNTVSAIGKIQTQLESFLKVFMHVFLGQDPSLDVSQLADVQIEKKGNTCTVTVTPVAEETSKGRKKSTLFSSATFTLDLKTGDFKTFRLNEKGENYTLYAFTQFSLDGPVKDSIFEL